MEILIIGIIGLVALFTWGVWILWSVCILYSYPELISISILVIFLIIWQQQKFPILRKILLFILGLSIVYSIWKEPNFFYINLINLLGLFALYKFSLVKDIQASFKNYYDLSYKKAEENFHKEKAAKFIAKKGMGALINHLTFTGVGSFLMKKYDEEINDKLMEFNLFSDANMNEDVNAIRKLKQEAMYFRYKVIIVYIIGSFGLIYLNKNITLNTYCYLFNPLKGIPLNIEDNLSMIDNQESKKKSIVVTHSATLEKELLSKRENSFMRKDSLDTMLIDKKLKERSIDMTSSPLYTEEKSKRFEEEHYTGTVNISNKDSSKVKHISLNENGISIYLTYPSSILKGESFKIKAEMVNNNRDAKQGGLTLSFPDIKFIQGNILNNNFLSLKEYTYPDKIFNQNFQRTMKTKYYMIEGWQRKLWAYGEKRYFELKLRTPENLKHLRVNFRGVLWINGKYDLKKIPSRSLISDQQGFAIQQFSIEIQDRTVEKETSLKEEPIFHKYKKCIHPMMVNGLSTQSYTNPKGYLAIRSGAGGKFRLLEKVINGDYVEGCYSEGNWVKIMYGCAESGDLDDNAKECKWGWVYKKYLLSIDGWDMRK